jgi:hypothetical protein
VPCRVPRLVPCRLAVPASCRTKRGAGIVPHQARCRHVPLGAGMPRAGIVPCRLARYLARYVPRYLARYLAPRPIVPRAVPLGVPCRTIVPSTRVLVPAIRGSCTVSTIVPARYYGTRVPSVQCLSPDCPSPHVHSVRTPAERRAAAVRGTGQARERAAR